MPPFEWDDGVAILISLLAAVLFFVALQAYRRRPTTRVLLFAAAFGMFFLKGVFIALGVLVDDENVALDALELLADAAILLVFFAGMTKG